jgi:hypothetical protein
MARHRDHDDNILQVGDRVRLSHVVCGEDENPPCSKRLGTIDHFRDGRLSDECNMAHVVFDTPLVANSCPHMFDDQIRHSCAIYLAELVLVQSMGNDPKQRKIETCLP